jgi:hypothetical protein
LDRQYGEFMREQDDPYKRAAAYMGLLGATPMLVNTKGSSTQSTSPGLGSILGGALQIGSMFTPMGWMGAAGKAAGIGAKLSDARVKKSIMPHSEKDGIRWYAFRYVWEDDDDPSGGRARHSGRPDACRLRSARCLDAASLRCRRPRRRWRHFPAWKPVRKP